MKKIFSCVMALLVATSMFAASELNIYASGLKAVQQDTMVTAYYTLNTQASELQLMIYGENINEAMSMTVTDPAAMTKGDHELTLRLPNDVPAAVYHWAIKVKADTTAFVNVTDENGMYNYYLPQDVAVDNNYNSPFFGRVYVSESTDGQANGGSDVTKIQTRGIYMYNPDLTFVNGDTMALHGYDGGMGGDRSENGRASFKRIAIDNAGYVYIASRHTDTKGIYRMDPANPTEQFIQILAAAEPVDAIGIVGNELFTLEGVSVGTGTMNRYNLSTSLGAPIMTMSQDTVLGFGNSDCDAAPDGRGGWWFSEHRYAPDAYPVLAHLTARGVKDYEISANSNSELVSNSDGGASYRGVVAVNPEGNMLAMGSNRRAVVFAIAYDETTGVPTLTKICETSILGGNIDGVAFDVANNLYVASASSERFYVYPMPKTDNQFVTPAPSNSKLYIGVPMPIQHLYLIGDNTGWNPTQGEAFTMTDDNKFEGVFTFTADTSYFAMLTALAETNDDGGWAYVNAHRYGGKNNAALLGGGKTDSLAMGELTFRIAPAGQYKLKVDLAAGIISVVRQAPIMPDNGMYIAFKDNPSDSDLGQTITTKEDIIAAGGDYIAAIPTATKIYNAREGFGIKIGNSSTAGDLKLQLVNSVKPSKIIVYAAAYKATEGTAIVMGDTFDLKPYGGRNIVALEKSFDGLTDVSEITLSAVANSEPRLYFLDMIIIPAEEIQPSVYRIKHPWDLNNIDPWIWQDCEEQADGTWALEDRYYGGGCNIDPKVLDQDWIGTPTLVGNPYNGDSCRFVINPAATDVAGILTITKLGEPNPVDTTVVVYDNLYEIGDNQGWHPAQAIEMTKDAENIFSGTFEFTAATSYFAFITVKPETDDWAVANANRFGGNPNNQLIADKGEYDMAAGELCFTSAPGTFKLTVNLNTKKLAVEVPQVGIENLNGEMKAVKVMINGQLYIIRDGVTYTATGAKVE